MSLRDCPRRRLRDNHANWLKYSTTIFWTGEYLKKTLNMNYVNHCREIDDTIEQLIKNSGIQLSHDQIFKLWWSTYLHDLGQRVAARGSKGTSYSDSKELYERHRKELSEFLGEIPYQCKEMLQADVAHLCLEHTDYIDASTGRFEDTMNRHKKLRTLKCLLRFAELVVPLEARNPDLCPKLCYKDYPSWVLTALDRCWPRRFRHRNFPCRYNLVYTTREFGKQGNRLTIKLTPNNDQITANGAVGNFLFTSYRYQLDREKKRMQKIGSLKITIDPTNNGTHSKFLEMAKAFTNDKALDKIYTYYDIIIGEKIANQLGQGTITDFIDEVSGDYVLDIFYNNEKSDLKDYDYTGFVIREKRNLRDGERHIIVTRDADSISFEYGRNQSHELTYNSRRGPTYEKLTEVLSVEGLISTVLYLSLDIWCNEKIYENYYNFNSSHVEGWIPQLKRLTFGKSIKAS